MSGEAVIEVPMDYWHPWANSLGKLDAILKRSQQELRKAELTEFRYAETRNWFRRLRPVTNQAQEIIDAREERSLIDLTKRIKVVLRKFDCLDIEKTTLDFEPIERFRETSSMLSETKKIVVGRNGDIEKIENWLLGENGGVCGTPCVYAIVGMAGSGKTTLAQIVFNDEKVIKKFDARIWVWVSHNFDVNKVLKEIIERCSGEPCEFQSLESMQCKLRELLKEKKFLLVLDDIWNENIDQWNKVVGSLRYGAPGSFILLTTRDPDVAFIAGADVDAQHKLDLLSHDDCWVVLKENSYLNGGQENTTLEGIGNEIVKKCGGLPLAAKSLGSLLLTREICVWKWVRDSETWKENDVLPALRLSLNRLEPYSRECFRFSTIYPKGYRMDKEQLIHLWMANGLVPSRQGFELEDMGNIIFNELVLKFFFDVSHDSIKMHDLMHDLGRSSRDDYFCLDGDDCEIPAPVLHLSIISRSSNNNILKALSKSHPDPCLHTCIFIKDEQHFSPAKIIFEHLECLRALDMSDTQLENLPESIGKSKQLRYLNLSMNPLKQLPDSVGTLTQLQTLILRKCSMLTHLPSIAGLVNLRHLDLSGCENLKRLPAGIPQMTNLRHLNILFCSNLL